MDGRIGEKIDNNSFLDIAVSESGEESGEKSVEPARRAEQNLPLRITKVSPGINYKLNKSSPSTTFPDKARIVSATDSSLPETAYAFDFRFVASDDEVRQLLVVQTSDKNRDVTLISHPDDLSQANLVTRLSISEEGRHALRSGKLFEGSTPQTLVMDIRKLSGDELPKFNDLLDPDNPCLYDKVNREKRPLGEHVSLLVVADPAQLASVVRRGDAPAVGAPGADFWRRINRPDNTWQFDTQTGNNPSLEINKVTPLLPEFTNAESATEDDNTVLIDCHLHSHWRQLLLGGPGVDKQGRIQHIPGRLESLRAGQRVILKGANWEDLAFEQTLRQMLAQKCFESNGKICPLPDNVQFYQMPVGNNELHLLFQSLSRSHDKEHASRNSVIINQSNIAQWLSPIAITPEGYAIPNTCLLEQIRAGGAVTVTSPLTEALWFRLLGSLQTIRETTGLEPRLQVTDSKRQPKVLGLTENDEVSLSCPEEKNKDQIAFSTLTYQQSAQASHWINKQPEPPLVIQVNEQTSFSQLFDNIHITSEQKAHFGHRQTKLQEALTAGKPVVLLGLENNPTLQQLLEPLMVGQPLLVNGQLQDYPKARVTILWPESVKSPSSIFHATVTTGEPCPEVDLWDINARKYDIARTKLPEQALKQLYKAFKTVPAHLCSPLPEITAGLLNNLIMAARRAQQVDHSLQLLPRHWRKAINSVITHGTRQHPSVRDFMKVACWHLLPDKTPDEDQAASVDPDQLAAIINSAPRLDRKFVRQNLWPLARAFDPAVFKDAELQLSYESPFPKQGKKDVMDRLCAIIVIHGPEEQRDALAYQLKVDLAAAELYQSLAIKPTGRIRRLQDALASDWHLPLPPGQTRSDAIQALASDCFHRARTVNSKSEGIERIKHRLSESLEWQSSADMPLSALARDLYHGEMSQKDRESRRLSRLHDRLTDSPVIFLQGETGTGKSYFSAKMARASGQASVISLGPSDSEQTLMKRWQWQEHADGDRSMVQQNQALMEWASTESDKDAEYITLVLDEANLTQAGLLASLNGLWEPQPCIYVNGHPVKVSEKHRVILTGNPDHYAGRQMDPALKEKLPRAYYPRLDQAFLRDRVVEPALLNHLQRHQINDIAHRATKSVMALCQYYQELLPGHEFTPRDLTDICSWVGWYLDRALSKGDSVSCEQVNSLIQQSFRDVLGPEITETQQDALSALEIWFAARYKLDNTLRDKVHNHTLPDIQRDFEAFTKEIRPEFDTSGSAIIELVQQLAQDLSRCQQAYHRKIKHGGRQATLIEGPAGRGKDATLNLLIKSVKQQVEERGETMPKVFPMNACDCSWDTVCEAIQKAKVDGGIVIISEMNLIDSQHLEGELNDILAGDAHPGFHLFATINPPEYSGRKPLSPALKGRFRHVPIRQYSPTELQTIAGKVLPENEQGKTVAKMLTEKHCRLRAYLQRKNLPLQPTSLDLQNVARAINRGGNFTEKAIHQYLTQHYRLYLMTAKLSLEELPESSALAMSKGTIDSGLCQWFNQVVPGISRPWLIRSSDRNSVDEKKHEIHIDTDLIEEEAKTEIIRMVAQAKWQASGLSLNPDKSDDILTRALYRHWQQCWFDRVFGQMGVEASGVFSLTEEEIQTLKISINQPYLQEADQRIRGWKSDDVRCWPEFWHQIRDLLNHFVSDYINKTSAVVGNKASGQSLPQVHEKQASVLAQRKNHKTEPAKALDWKTDYENHEKRHFHDYRVFDKENFPSRNYRWLARDIYISPEGNIEQIIINHKHVQGVEVLIPARLPEDDQEVTLASDQTLATLVVTPRNGLYALPSLTVNDYIVALRMESRLSFVLLRDRYTGLHTVSVQDDRANQSIKFAYVVESGKEGKKKPAEEVQPAQSTRFDARCSKDMKTVLKEVLTNIKEQPHEVQEPLRRIKSAKNTTQRIEAIRDYCRGFSGVAIPAERNKNFFHFLVTQRQGSCRHRVPVFMAFCRYFGIPCRAISNFLHSFAEYSPDQGQTWESVDLGGAPADTTKHTPAFQLTRRLSGSGTELKKTRDLLKNVLKDADLAQQQTLAKAYGISLKELNKTLETDCALPKKNLSTFEIVKNLWEEKELTGFAMGVSILQSLETEVLSEDDKALVGKVIGGGRPPYKPMSEALKPILSNSDEDQVTELLKSLHSKMIDQAGTSPDQWLCSIVDVLANSDLTRPSVIHFAREALESGWLDPVPTYSKYTIAAVEHHKLLMRLEEVDELNIKAAHCLKKWYQLVMSGEKNQQWQSAYEIFQQRKENAFFITDPHNGHSSFLKNIMASPSVEMAWTDKPEGVPNIERLLLHHPAFVQLNSGKGNHRPVIILGQISLNSKVNNEKAEALFQRKLENNPYLQQISEKTNQSEAMKQPYINALIAADSEQERLDIISKYQSTLKSLEVPSRDKVLVSDLKDQCQKAIQQAFIYYLYEMTHSKGGGLTYCWADAFILAEDDDDHCGAHAPSSPGELYAMMSLIKSSDWSQEAIKDDYLRQTYHASDALILKTNELTKIVEEFLNSLNLSSLCDALDA
ncbi:AAA family ATPase [Endozoicomonas sp. 8E]|uniref:AAA family ATPase n=1 Tax=Endozoicomonas sp. 8E TaxID=3035692 RepID=UPI0029391D9C|nr:AAA family ATPase [Endozoicomonas sp. 8E]WOG28852.1 AAA family ATPase [Endozoicomonas sp. 8E]